MHDKVVSHLREARAELMQETNQGKNSRENSITITKIDEAILWRKEHHRLNNDENKKPKINSQTP